MLSEADRVAARFNNIQPLGLGRIVHFVCRDGKTIRPAMVVRPWGNNSANLQVFYDGTNDIDARRIGGEPPANPAALTEWVTSCVFDGGEPRRAEEAFVANDLTVNQGQTYTHYNPYTWHWPPRS